MSWKWRAKVQITFKSAGLQSAINDLESFRAQSPVASAYAINRTVTVARASSVELMKRQINFPASYYGQVNDPSARLAITERATPDKLEGRISARNRPTSLARFATYEKPKGTTGFVAGVNVRVAVKPNEASRSMGKGAFVVNLKNGNQGVALRIRPGETLRSSHKAYAITPNLYLLYGPSVDQAFQSVRADIAPAAEVTLRTEYFRQIDRLGIFR